MALLHAQAQTNHEIVLKALEANLDLRHSITNIFGILSGDVDKKEASNGRKEVASKFHRGLRKTLSDVEVKFAKVEKLTTSITSISKLTLNLPMSWLALDPGMGLKHRDTVATQKWYCKVNEYSQVVLEYINEESVRRASQTCIGSKNFDRSQKVQIVYQRPVETAAHIERILTQLKKQQFIKHMVILRQAGKHKFLRLRVGNTFAAYIILWSLNVQKVFVKGLEELVRDEDYEFDLETPSQISLFRKISDNATLALHYYAHKALKPEHQLLMLMRYLVSFRTLFADRCSFCMKTMKDGLPPYLRNLDDVDEGAHESCRVN